MQEIQLNEHHYKHKILFLGVLVLILGVTVWTNVLAQRVVVISLPNSYEVTEVKTQQDMSDEGGLRLQSGVLSDISSNIFITPGQSSGEILMSGMTNTGSSIVTITGSQNISGITLATGGTQTGIVAHTGSKPDAALTYARKVEDLITRKGQETRLNMIDTMNKFLVKVDQTNPTYDTVTRIVQIIMLGDVVHRLEYCTQFDGPYKIELFGVMMSIRSTIKYNTSTKKCVMTYQYPDGSVHTCRLNDIQKGMLAQMVRYKQGLLTNTGEVNFESLMEQYLKQSVCAESQKAIKLSITPISGNQLSGITTTGTVAPHTRWKF